MDANVESFQKPRDMFTSVAVFLIAFGFVANEPCKPKLAAFGTVCVCDSSYCDTVPKLEDLESGTYQMYTSSKQQLGFNSKTGKFESNRTASTDSTIAVNLDKTYQTILGFGGAFTDSTGYNILTLPQEAQDKLMMSYFGDDGISYTIGRMPISGTDFSLRGYTYCDEKDETLEAFALQDEDFKYKMPFVKKAEALRGRPMTLFASSWAPPAWMKTNNNLRGGGHLKDEYYDLWGQYYLKFFRAYQKYNFTFWAVSVQNEPVYGLTKENINGLGFYPDEMNKWVSKYLGPKIRNSEFKDVKIMLHEDNRGELVSLINYTLNNSEVMQYADGVAVHWYEDHCSAESLLDEATKAPGKDLFLLNTEACILSSDQLGSWENGELYAKFIIVDMYHNSLGFVDWNMVLNLESGPSWAGSRYDAPVIVNATAGEFYKQPLFYTMGHFSKFVVPGSLRLETKVADSLVANDFTSIAFLRPDGKVAVVMSNRGNDTVSVDLNISEKRLSTEIEARSLNTLLYTV